MLDDCLVQVINVQNELHQRLVFNKASHREITPNAIQLFVDKLRNLRRMQTQYIVC